MTETKPKTKAVAKAKPSPKAVTKEEKPTQAIIRIPISPSDYLDFPRTVEEQYKLISMPTPKRHIKKRPGKGGQTFDYVTLNYVVGRLNAITKFDWDFEIISYEKSLEQMMIALQGRLTLRLEGGKVITKTAFGGSDIKVLRDDPKKMVDFANDLKSAQADCLKKAASLAGVCWDVYAGYSEFNVPETIIEHPEQVDEEEEVLDAEVVPPDEPEPPSATPLAKEPPPVSVEGSMIQKEKTKAQAARDKLEEQIEKDKEAESPAATVTEEEEKEAVKQHVLDNFLERLGSKAAAEEAYKSLKRFLGEQLNASKQRFFVRLNQFNAWSLMEGELEDVKLLKEHFNYVFGLWVKYEQAKAKEEKKSKDEQVPF